MRFGFVRSPVLALAVFAASFVALPASAEVRRTGDWSDDDPEISLHLHRVQRTEALRKVARQAGWNLVVNLPRGGEPVDLHVRGERASKVLDFLLSDGSYLAQRSGSFVSISRPPPDPPKPPTATPAVPTVPAVPAAPTAPQPPAVPRTRGADRVVSGGELRIDRHEIVHDVVVFGGNVDVFGVVTGDLAVMGGSARVHDGARVLGDASTVGGTLDLDDGSVVDGEVAVVGGRLHRGRGAQVGGEKENEGASSEGINVGGTLRELARDAGDAVTRAALFFVFGAVLLALGAGRMEGMKTEIAARPMRSFALGVVASIAALVALVLLCITLVGIPFALMGALAAFLATGAGLVSVLETVGAALIAHRTKNPYVHLAVGCALLLVLGAIPFLGAFVKFGAALAGAGAFVATRGAGIFVKRVGTWPAPGSSYRTIEPV